MSNQPVATVTPDNLRTAYELRFHFGWYTHGRKPLFADLRLRAVAEDVLTRVTEEHDFHLLEWELEPIALRALLSLKPETAPTEVTRLLRGNLAADARRLLGLHNLWSRGWFVRSSGDVSNETIRAYVARQFEHHRAIPQDAPHSIRQARFHDAGDPAELRASSHAVFEYNLHLVFTVQRRCDFLDAVVAEALLAYWRRVCDNNDWRLWDAEILGDHAHLFLGVAPKDAPQAVGLSLMNNGEYFLDRRYAAAFRELQLTGVWQAGCFLGTVGSATTAQIKSYLQRAADDGELE